MGRRSTGWDVVGRVMGHEIVDMGRCPNTNCGHRTYVPIDLADKLWENGNSFYCPSGHGQSFDGQKKRDEIAAAKRRERLAREEAEHAAAMREIAERTCPWPTCDGRLLASPRGLRQHMVKAHGAPWASPELDIDEVGQVLNGRDPEEVVH